MLVEIKAFMAAINIYFHHLLICLLMETLFTLEKLKQSITWHL